MRERASSLPGRAHSGVTYLPHRRNPDLCMEIQRMSRRPVLHWLPWLAGPLLALACSHDSPRDNPLDPQLTPPVTLQVALDDTTGTATLTWTQYEGDQPFAAYWVQRKVRGMEMWDTLKSLDLAGQVAFLDTSLSPDTAYEYRVAVVNASGHAELSNRETVAGYTVKAVRLLAAESDPAAGAIRLRWNRYRDPGFAAYEVVRRQVGTGLDTVLFLGHNVADTVYIDGCRSGTPQQLSGWLPDPAGCDHRGDPLHLKHGLVQSGLESVPRAAICALPDRQTPGRRWPHGCRGDCLRCGYDLH